MPEPRETLLMADVGEETEPVLVVTEPSAARLVLDDGTELSFDRRELLAALEAPAAALREAA